MRISHQLAAYSPISLTGISAAARAAVSSSGDPRAELSSDIADTYAADSVVLCASGTHALQLALGFARERVGGDKRAAFPAFTCYDIATAAIGADSTIELYDIDPEKLAPEFDSLERVLKGGARIVVVAPFYGVPVEWDAIEELASRYGAIVIEDAAQSHGASLNDRPVGSLGLLSVLSFGRGKGWTGGSGGALLLRGSGADVIPPRLADASGESRNVAALLAQWTLGRPAIYGIPRGLPLGLGSTHYRTPDVPRAMTCSAAAALLESCGAALQEAEHRRKSAKRILHRLSSELLSGTIGVPPGGRAGYLRFPLRLPRGMGSFKDEAIALAAGIAPTYPTTLADLPQVRGRMAQVGQSWPGARSLVSDLVTLPVHSRLGSAELEAVIRIVEGSRLS